MSPEWAGADLDQATLGETGRVIPVSRPGTATSLAVGIPGYLRGRARIALTNRPLHATFSIDTNICRYA